MPYWQHVAGSNITNIQKTLKTTRIQTAIFLLLVGLSAAGQTQKNLAFGTDSTFEVATWNIESFPKNGQVTVDYVIDIIEVMNVDVFAIQEVNNISEFEQMTGNLVAYEGYLESGWFAGLAYIYKPAVVEINDMYEIYTTQPYWSPFPRSPMVMDLNYKGEKIIIINNHFKCCGDEILDLSDPDDEETRRYQASALLKTYIDSYFPDENVIVLGDLNDNLSDNSQNNVFQMILDDTENYLFADYEIAMGNNAEWSYPTWPSHLDHILITNELFDDFENEGSAVSTIKIDEYLAGGWWQYEENISDHRPVALKLDMNTNTGLSDNITAAPQFWNYPNPVRSGTTFYIHLHGEPMDLEIFNMHGEKLFSESVKSGETSITWNTQKIPNGTYAAHLKSKNKTITTLKLLVIR